MSSNYTPSNIDDLARLARETCVYRGNAQSMKSTTGSRWLSIGKRLRKWLTLIKH